MARNKYPEETVEKVLQTSLMLFMTKGYDNTTIQDIVDNLDGLTKGAIYHHFKSKAEIMDALGEKMFLENNPFTIVKQREDLTSLQKMREIIRLDSASMLKASFGMQGIPLMKNPHILASSIEGSRKWVTPLWQELIEAGNLDGSLNVKHPKEVAEILQVLSGIWLSPAIYPATGEEIYQKFLVFKELLESMGLPLIDESILALMQEDIKELQLWQNASPI